MQTNFDAQTHSKRQTLIFFSSSFAYQDFEAIWWCHSFSSLFAHDSQLLYTIFSFDIPKKVTAGDVWQILLVLLLLLALLLLCDLVSFCFVVNAAFFSFYLGFLSTSVVSPIWCLLLLLLLFCSSVFRVQIVFFRKIYIRICVSLCCCLTISTVSDQNQEG